MNNFSRVVISSSVLVGGAVSAYAGGFGTAYGEGSIQTKFYNVGSDLEGTWTDFSEGPFTTVSGTPSQTSVSGVDNSDASFTFANNAVNNLDYQAGALANPTGNGSVYGYNELFWTITNNGSKSESFSVSVTTQTWSYASSQISTDYSQGMSYGAFVDSSTGYGVSANSMVTASNTLVQDVTLIGTNSNQFSTVVNGPGYQTYSGSATGSETVIIAPGGTDQLTELGFGFAQASSVPSPAAAVPFVVGLVAVARKRRSTSH